MHKILIFLYVGAILLLSATNAFAVEMEFNIGFAFDQPVVRPLPELSAGYGYNFAAGLWFKERFGLALGAISTKHDLNGGINSVGQSFEVDSKRDIIYLEARYRLYQAGSWQFLAHLGYNPTHDINGGDSSGSYVEYRDSANYNSEDIGYSGSGYWLGFSIYRGIDSFHKGYYAFISFKYNFINYSTWHFWGIAQDIGDTQQYFLARYQAETDYSAESFIVNLGVVLKFDLADF